MGPGGGGVKSKMGGMLGLKDKRRRGIFGAAFLYGK